MSKIRVLVGALLLVAPIASGATRTWPDTSCGIHVFNDQLPEGMSNPQIQFAATHYAGVQKMIRTEANRLRRTNSNFLVLHYRLGLGLGYRAVTSGCRPEGDWLHIIEGNWVQEWPGDSSVACILVLLIRRPQPRVELRLGLVPDGTER